MTDIDPVAAMARLSFWILDEDGRTPVRAGFEDAMRWMAERDGLASRVAQDRVGSVTVSTVFLSTMSFDGRPPRLGIDEGRLFETATFDGEDVRVVARYGTWAEAEAGHARTVAKIAAS